MINMTFQFQFYDILHTFYASAFTLIVHKRGLCPKDGFTEVTKLGIKIPWFVHPSSIDYVKEVSEKIVIFMKKNVLEGAVLHVMIEKDKKPHAIQRLVFRPSGGFDVNEFEQLDPIRSEEILESVKAQCVTCLLDIQRSELSEVDCPWFSRWSVSIGLKKSFLSKCRNAGPKGPFAHDPNRVYFPWKKRARQGRKPKSVIFPIPKFPIRKTIMTTIASLKKAEITTEEKVEANAPRSPDLFSDNDVAEESSSKSMDTDSMNLSSLEETNSGDTDDKNDPKDFLISPFSKPVEMEYLTSSEEDCDTEAKDVDDKPAKSLTPISSFQIISGRDGGLMMNVYSIEYPFDPLCYEAMTKASKKAEDKLLHPQQDDHDFL